MGDERRGTRIVLVGCASAILNNVSPLNRLKSLPPSPIFDRSIIPREFRVLERVGRRREDKGARKRDDKGKWRWKERGRGDTVPSRFRWLDRDDV